MFGVQKVQRFVIGWWHFRWFFPRHFPHKGLMEKLTLNSDDTKHSNNCQFCRSSGEISVPLKLDFVMSRVSSKIRFCNVSRWRITRILYVVVVTKHDRRLKLLPIPITLPFVPMQLDIISCICSSEYTITLEGLFGSRDISRFGTFFLTQSTSSAILWSGNFSLSIVFVYL